MSTKTTTRPPDTRAVRRVSLPDRIALRIGLWLILWSRRTTPVPMTVDFATRQRIERERREQQLRVLLRSGTMHLWR
ncbi:hypothetical protein JOE58_000848 [Curtobacterium luteum]|uniref:Uncharacterized protein n=1 Tax=Curtobacterium luteum TaxID=33881 RepID=A0A8H9KX15_9MICO|nr:hypothetical protein [Curtobacterium luteum]MBM7801597.1 hypothetical protein [Curtobacterium luteum]NUU52081.1 hypothetical protein [Curtobacterium luteum]GGK89280.1 hypothetical protein GCM10009769_04070 [Curtobacterium luteum]